MTRLAGRSRLVMVATGAALFSAALAAPANADVTVTPDRAARGDAAKLTFRVSDERGAAYTTKIDLFFPVEAPIAEVWPLTVPDWAPRMTTRKLDRPLTGVHHGQVTEVASQITWFRAAAAKPTDVAELQISAGPMPETDRMIFTVVQTYSDGTVVRWDQPPAADGVPVANQAAVVTLTAPAAGAPGGADAGAHGGHGTNPGTGVNPGTGTDAGTDAGGQERAADKDDGGGLGSLATGLLIGLLIGGGVAIWLARGRRGGANGGAGANAGAGANGATGAAESDEAGPAGPDGPSDEGPAAVDGTRGKQRQTVPERRAWRLRE